MEDGLPRMTGQRPLSARPTGKTGGMPERKAKRRRRVRAAKKSIAPILAVAFVSGIAVWIAGRVWAKEEVNRQFAGGIPCERKSGASPALKTAVVAMEDGRFRQHHGVEWSSVWQAAMRNSQEGRVVMGGSTITQQLAKNLFLPFERTWNRKVREYFLTLELEGRWSKDEILECYLEVVDFGYGSYGAKAAAKRYFNITPGRLNKSQSLFLAASLRLPPRDESGLMRVDRDRGLAASRVKYWLPTEEGWEEAAAEPIPFPGLSLSQATEEGSARPRS